jgi:3-dehydrotetronate 4-kinase
MRHWDSLTLRAHVPVFDFEPLAVPDAAVLAVGAIDRASQRLGPTPIVITVSAAPEKVATEQRQLGRDVAGVPIDGADCHGLGVARCAVPCRGRRDTSGAVVSRLGVRSVRIGSEIDPGSPWTYAEGGEASLVLARKSDNFGRRDFFLKALGVLD